MQLWWTKTESPILPPKLLVWRPYSLSSKHKLEHYLVGLGHHLPQPDDLLLGRFVGGLLHQHCLEVGHCLREHRLHGSCGPPSQQRLFLHTHTQHARENLEVYALKDWLPVWTVLTLALLGSSFSAALQSASVRWNCPSFRYDIARLLNALTMLGSCLIASEYCSTASSYFACLPPMRENEGERGNG